MCQYIAQEFPLHENDGMNEPTFGAWLELQRRRRKLTQRAFGEAAALKPSYISKIENGHIFLPDEETRFRIHAVLGTTEDDLVTAGILERIEPIEPGGPPVYIAAEHITNGDRAAEAAHRRLEGRAASSTSDDPRAVLMAMLARASDDDVRKAIQILGIIMGGIAANQMDIPTERGTGT